MKLLKETLTSLCVLAFTAWIMTGCGGRDGPSDPPVPTSVSVLAGDQQTAQTLQALPVPVAVLVRDADGTPMPGALVIFVANDGGSVSSDRVLTSANGEASARWTLGPLLGRQTLSVLIAEVAPVEIEAMATSQVASIAKVSGDLQFVPRFGFLSEPLEVFVSDALGRPADVEVVFKTRSESGFVGAEYVRTDPDTGKAAAPASGSLYFSRAGTAWVDATVEGVGNTSFLVNVATANAAHPYDGLYLGNIGFKIINGVILKYNDSYTVGTLDENAGSITIENGLTFMGYTYNGKVVIDTMQQATASGLYNKRSYIVGSAGPWVASRQ